MELNITVWHLISSVLVFILGFILNLKLAKSLRTKRIRAVYIYMWHTFFCIIYLLYSLTTSSDSLTYYGHGLNGDWDFKFGTQAVNFLTSLIVQGFGLSVLGTSLVFNMFGVIGLMYFDVCLRFATRQKPKLIKKLINYIVFLPSVSFWSCAIGKDSLSFMSINLALWASLSLNKRWLYMLLSVSVMFFVRPHIAGIMIIAIIVLSTYNNSFSLGKKILFRALSIILGLAIIPFGIKYAGVGELSTKELSSYTENLQAGNMAGGGSIDISSMSFPMQLFTYMFRPSIFDAHTFFALFTAIENIFLLGLFLYGLKSLLKRSNSINVPNALFLWTYALLSWSILAVSTSNLGIATRQKWMFAPILIYLLFSKIQFKFPKTRMKYLHNMSN